MSTILVTGATGNLGSNVVRQLLDRGQNVRAYARQPRPSIPASVPLYQGDISVGSTLDEATRGVDVIIHCASLFQEGYATDLQGSRHLIEAAKANGTPHLVYVSIVGIDRSPFSYFQAKLAVEQMIEQSGLPYSILRVTQFHDFVLSTITSAVDEQTATITIPAETRFQSIDVSEVATALVALAEQPASGRVSDIGGPEVLTLEEMAESYLRVSHQHYVVRSEGPETFPGEYNDELRSDAKLVPDRAVGHITWESFLQERVEKLV